MGIIISDQDLEAPAEMQVLNYKTGGLFRFINQRRNTPVTELILHETVTSSAKATLAVLQQRNLGVHLIVGADGTVYQHGDLKDDLFWHASEHNPKSVGIEVVNPYYPELIPKSSEWATVIAAPWAHKGKYTVPTATQAEVVCDLTRWLTSSDSVGLDIPRKWVGLADQKMLMTKGPVSALGGGIYAHHYFGHADGCWLALYTWLRIEAQLDSATAYDTAVQLATGAKGSVDLSPYYEADPYLA
jgi:hypothetical protein